MSLWSDLISEGTILFTNKEQLLNKRIELVRACDELKADIRKICQSDDTSLNSLIAIKTKSGTQKSSYEGINQLAHYWYCVAAALRLFDIGCTNIEITGGSENNESKGDVVATKPDGSLIVGEVYCVSSALWPTKTLKEIKKLSSLGGNVEKFIFYNIEAKSNYSSKSKDIAFYGCDRNSSEINLMYYKDSNNNSNLVPQTNLSCCS